MSLTNEDKDWITARVTALLQSCEDRTAAEIERIKTALLTAFNQWASPQEMRKRTHSAVLRVKDLDESNQWLIA